MVEKKEKPLKRMAPSLRRQQIIDAAIDYFAEAGFAVQTRELSRRIGISQPLLYRYFPSKAALIDVVLETVFLYQKDDHWLDELRDRSIPLKQRLKSFYGRYVQRTYNKKWLRIYFFAALANFDFNGLYVKGVVQNQILTTICTELRHAILTPDQLRHAPEAIEPREIELAWMLQSSLFYGMVRKHVLRAKPEITEEMRLNDVVELFFNGANALYPTQFMGAENDTN